MGALIPDELTQSIMQGLVEGFRRQEDFLLGPEEQRRRGHLETMPEDEWETVRASRAERFAEWRRLTDELIEDGTLDYAHCYECGGELEHNQERPSEWVWDESEAEHIERVGEPYSPPVITFATKKVEFPRD
jgi:hypothetical protein